MIARPPSQGRRKGARLTSGERRSVGVNAGRTIVEFPYPSLAADSTLRTLICGVALQCAPSKELVGNCRLHELKRRGRCAR